MTAILDDAGINYLSVTGRAKSVASFAAKAAADVDGVPRSPTRCATSPTRSGSGSSPTCTATSRPSPTCSTTRSSSSTTGTWARRRPSEGRFGYASRHLLVALDAGRASPRRRTTPLRGRRAQVQIRTVLQHAWAEFEHDIRYKGTIPDEHVPDFDRRFTLAAGLLELADREFSTIRDRLQAASPDPADEPERDDPRISPRELAAFLAGQYADAGWSRTDHYAWISGLLLELGITSLDELGELAALRRRRRAQRSGWATATRPARSAGSTTPCWRCSATVRRAARQRPPPRGARSPAARTCPGRPGGRQRRAGRSRHPSLRSLDLGPHHHHAARRPAGRAARSRR